MADRVRTILSGYAAAAGLTALAVAARRLIDPWLGDDRPLATLYGAVAASVWFAGYRPALFAAAAGYLVCNYLFIEPRRTFTLADPRHVIGLAAYLVSCAAIIGFGEGMRGARRRADAERREALARQERTEREAAERRAAEGRLRESEERFARFARHLPGLAWIKDARGRYVFANDAAERAFGAPREKLYGRTDDEVFPPETAARFRENDRAALGSGAGGAWQVIETLRHPDGAVHHSLVSKFPIPAPDGSPGLVGGVAFDVTDRLRAEEAVRFVSEAGAVLASSLDYEATLAAVARLVVPRLADWCGVHVAEPGGGLRQLAVAHADPAKVEWAREVARRYPPDPEAPRGVPRVVRTGEPEMASDITDEMLALAARDPEHLALLRSLGTRSAMIVPMTARGRTLGAITFVVAESGRRYGPADLELALEVGRRVGLAVDNARLFGESQQALGLLSTLVEASGRLTSSLDPPAVHAAILDLSHRLVAADAYAVWRHDPAADEWTLAESAGLSAGYVRDQGRMPAGGHPMPEKPIIEEDALEAGVLEHRRAAYRAEGIASVLAVPLRVHGRVGGTLAFYYRTRRRLDDVTVRVATALADLAGSAVGTTDLYGRETELRRRAEEADRRKDEFLALLGHELRNPLAPIRNAVEILSLRGDDPSFVARARDMIGRQVAQMTKLVDELLDASRIARGKVRLTPARLDLAALVRTAAGDHRAELDAAGLGLAVEVPDRPVWVRGDEGRLMQVLGNLLSNARKFTDPGGRVTVRVAEEGGEAVLAVADTGVGIAPEGLAGLFQAFHQVETGLARSKGGLGLGLAVIKGLVELHGGRVGATSGGPGCGAEFVIRLPSDRSAGPAPAAENGTAPAPAGRRVVVIEDGVDTAESLRMLLELRGFEAAVAHTGPDGLALARRVRPDAVVCDLGLPGMTGFEVARELRADPATAGAVLVCVSGYGQDEDRRKAREAGFDALLVKPADDGELMRVLSRPRG